MSKKMKRGALESSSFGFFEDPKARLKHQTLLQDFQELQKETYGIKHKLEDMKLRKLQLLAEVRFLRKRRKYLSQVKSSLPQELVAPPISDPRLKNRLKDQLIRKNEAKLKKLPPLPGPKTNGRIQIAKDATSKKTSSTHVNHKLKLGSGIDTLSNNAVFGLNRKAAAAAAPAFELKQNERLYTANNAAVLRSPMPRFDLNQDTGHSSKEAGLPTRAPIFDLNEISMGEEEPQPSYEFEESNRNLAGNLNDDPQQNDLTLLGCRNLGDGTSRVGKRKISWQDPVALRV